MSGPPLGPDSSVIWTSYRGSQHRNAAVLRLLPASQPACANDQADAARSKVADLAASLALRNRYRNRRLVDILPDERAFLHVVSPPFLRLGTRQPGATLERRMPRERPPTQSVHSAIMGTRLGNLNLKKSKFRHYTTCPCSSLANARQ